ncbi:sodium-coupled monocarboxylate transporter 2-like [Pollicipes pollicipes]|uniref:sodium-coupled monocarboxylate transporter 2-like n=1 Tax=Pollicipes pollicipes TaxID=41117 RepID=UPI001885940D|nr:sodium-coupled monocarboxylate transporter 2-like [Pollicipes pollicipes]
MATRQTFGIVDYCVFGSVLLLSLLIGVYNAIRGKQTNEELLLGGRKMSIIPVAVSTMASFLSAILILGSPAEMYMNGVQYWITVLPLVVLVPAVSMLFVPIFYRCSITTVYEYLEFRACLLNAPATILYKTLACLTGLAIFATYADCDPLKMGLIEKKDQLVPYFVLDQMAHITGLPGLFVACIMSAALSTISSGLNSLAAITWQDFLSNISLFKDMSEGAVVGMLTAGAISTWAMFGCNRREVGESLVNPLAYKLFNWINRFTRDDSSDPRYAADNPIFIMPTYKQTEAN